jgi:GAF domain-containing protein
MPPAPLPQNESERYIALMAYRARGLVADVGAVKLVREARAYFEAQQAVIALVGRKTVYFLAEAGAGFDSLPRELSFCAYAIHNRTPLVVEDARLDPRFSDNPAVAGPPGLRFYAGAPLVDVEGYCLGTFCLVDVKSRSLQPESLACLVDFSRRAMRLIELQKTMSALLDTYGGRTEGMAVTGAVAVSPARQPGPPPGRPVVERSPADKPRLVVQVGQAAVRQAPGVLTSGDRQRR